MRIPSSNFLFSFLTSRTGEHSIARIVRARFLSSLTPVGHRGRFLCAHIPLNLVGRIRRCSTARIDRPHSSLHFSLLRLDIEVVSFARIQRGPSSHPPTPRRPGLRFPGSRALSEHYTLRILPSSSPLLQTGGVGTPLRALAEHIPIVRGQRARVPTPPVCPPLTATPSPHTPSPADIG